MELNKKVGRELTTEQKVKFQKENGKFNLLNNIVILPILTTLLGIYLESIGIVSVSIGCIIIFLVLKIFSISKKNIVYEDVIIPIILKEKFDNITTNIKEDFVEEFRKSQLLNKYDKVKIDRAFCINNEKYNINVAKINVQRMDIEENDGVVDKHLDVVLEGIFASVKLPKKSLINFRAISKEIEEKAEDVVKIPNMEFDRSYDVYSLNPVEVRNLLSPGVMARILEFNSKIERVISFSINEDMLYVAIDYKEFLEFKGKGKEYVNENLAQENLDILDVLTLFMRYIYNMFEI